MSTRSIVSETLPFDFNGVEIVPSREIRVILGDNFPEDFLEVKIGEGFPAALAEPYVSKDLNEYVTVTGKRFRRTMVKHFNGAEKNCYELQAFPRFMEIWERIE